MNEEGNEDEKRLVSVFVVIWLLSIVAMVLILRALGIQCQRSSLSFNLSPTSTGLLTPQLKNFMKKQLCMRKHFTIFNVQKMHRTYFRPSPDLCERDQWWTPVDYYRRRTSYSIKIVKIFHIHKRNHKRIYLK